MGELDVVVRTSSDPLYLASDLRRLVHETDARLAVDTVGALAERVSDSLGRARFVAGVLGAFSTIALSLAGIGLYGVLSYTVSMRKRELGIRAALGAERVDLVRLVLRQVMTVTVAGCFLGLLAALGTTPLMTSLLFGIKPRDAFAFSAAPVLMLVVAAAASIVPARRVAASDPAAVLRCD